MVILRCITNVERIINLANTILEYKQRKINTRTICSSKLVPMSKSRLSKRTDKRKVEVKRSETCVHKGLVRGLHARIKGLFSVHGKAITVFYCRWQCCYSGMIFMQLGFPKARQDERSDCGCCEREPRSNEGALKSQCSWTRDEWS